MLFIFLKDAAKQTINRSSHPEVFLGKGVLKIYSKFTGEHPCLCNFIEITLRHGCSPVNLLHIFRTHFLNSTSGRLLLKKYPTSSVPKKLTTYITCFDKLGYAMTESLSTADLSVCILRNLG